MLKRIISHLKPATIRLFRLVWFLSKVARSAIQYRFSKNSALRQAYVRLHGRKQERRLLLVAAMLSTAGFQVWFRVSAAAFVRWNQYGRMVFAFPNVFIAPYDIHGADLVVEEAATDTSDNPKTIRLVYRTDRSEHPNIDHELYFPIMHHPNLLIAESGAKQKTVGLNAGRDILVLFAGNVDEAKYNRDHLATNWGITNRYITIGLIKKRLREWVREYDSAESFYEDMEAGVLRNRIAILETHRAPIPQTSWLSVLSRSNYFLALPGVAHPFCHNIVESMMVGTIPFTQYGSFFNPPLEHGENALLYTSIDQLIKGLEDLLTNQNENSLPKMRRQAIEYYENHLCLEAAANAIESFMEDDRSSVDLVLAGPKLDTPPEPTQVPSA